MEYHAPKPNRELKIEVRAFNLSVERPDAAMFQKLRKSSVLIFGVFLAFTALGAGADPTSGGPRINFQRQVRPILSDNCFLCHGPDQGTRMADVRLDIREGAFATRKRLNRVQTHDRSNDDHLCTNDVEPPHEGIRGWAVSRLFAL